MEKAQDEIILENTYVYFKFLFVYPLSSSTLILPLFFLKE